MQQAAGKVRGVVSKNCGRRAENVTRSLRFRPSRRGPLRPAIRPGGFASLSLIFMFSPSSSLCLTEPSFFAGSCQLPQDSTPGPVCSPRHTQMLLDFQTPPHPRSLARAPRVPRGAWLCFLLFPAVQLVDRKLFRDNTPSFLFGSLQNLEGAFKNNSFVDWLMPILN